MAATSLDPVTGCRNGPGTVRPASSRPWDVRNHELARACALPENPLIAARGPSHLSTALAWAPLGLTLALAAGTLVLGADRRPLGRHRRARSRPSRSPPSARPSRRRRPGQPHRLAVLRRRGRPRRRGVRHGLRLPRARRRTRIRPRRRRTRHSIVREHLVGVLLRGGAAPAALPDRNASVAPLATPRVAPGRRSPDVSASAFSRPETLDDEPFEQVENPLRIDRQRRGTRERRRRPAGSSFSRASCSPRRRSSCATGAPEPWSVSS